MFSDVHDDSSTRAPDDRSLTSLPETSVGGMVPAVSHVPQRAPMPRAGAAFPFSFWRFSSNERRKHERDSLRSRSKEGRPGSRKHRRYTHSVDLVNSLRRVMSARGEEDLPADVDAVEEERPRVRPSAFYRLLECEGAANALEAWAAAESRGRSPRRARPKGDAWEAEEHVRQVRRAFRENWQFLAQSESSQELIAKLEELTQVAFGKTRGLEEEDLLMWQLMWTGGDLATEAGAPPADEMLLMGLNATERKVVHQLARLIGLHSESRLLGECQGEDLKADKALALRPPRSLRCRTGSWAAPFSVSQVLISSVTAS
ncbi:COX11 [Symbiodinium natans]|uniref:COX11 protein n=1 Tax=Symbiodinium natans TaxID=878477 RepID=A0A812IJC2_9DINO|nr:COX11 [Symbiodinium natans]